MAQINIDTTHSETSTSSLSGDALEVYIDEQIAHVEGQVVSGSTSGTSGSSGSSGINGTNYSLTLIEITGATILQATNIYVRASGDTYDITLPAATGTLNVIQIKNLTAGEKTIKPSGDDLIDYTTTKAMAQNAAAIFLDAGVGLWDIN